MQNNPLKRGVLCAASIALILSSQLTTATPQQRSPNPILVFVGADYSTRDGKEITRYLYEVFNRDAYPAQMFAAAPGLPPCGTNANSSRTWIDLYDQRGQRLNSFCAITKPGDLTGIWFALESNVIPPSYIYIEMTDRQTNTKYKSNLADSVL